MDDIQIFCNRCNLKTHHKLLFKDEKEYHLDDTEGSYIRYAKRELSVLSCMGCDSVTFSETWVTDEDCDPETGEFIPSISYYPLRTDDTLAGFSFEEYCLLGDLSEIYQEVIKSYNYSLKTLCAAGIRALIEGICKEQNINDGFVPRENKRKKNLEGKIYGMLEKNIITPKSFEALHELRFLGNDALHELDIPKKHSLKNAIEIIEHVAENIYIIPQKTKNLAKR